MNDVYELDRIDPPLVDQAPPFEGMPKLPRWSRDIVITEKIDGTNGQIVVLPDGQCLAGSKGRYLDPDGEDHYGFAAWVRANQKDLAAALGPGRHFGEWWGRGIQRNYGLSVRRFSLFNTSRWAGISTWYPLGGKERADMEVAAPPGLDCVPVLYHGMMDHIAIGISLSSLLAKGSCAAPGFKNPEGIVIFHTASGTMFKKTLVNDHKPKGSQEVAHG